MFKKNIGKERIKIRIKKMVILIVSLILILGLFKLFHYYGSQRKIISEFKNTKIRERLITNNKKVQMDKPYKVRNDIVYVPVLELCKNFNTSASYKFLPGGKIELKYRKSSYILERGSNEVRFEDNHNIIKMDGIVEFMDDTLYVPLDFIYKILDVNVVQASDGTVYMDNYPKKFNYSWVKENRYIAHALGGIDGNVYTNSRQAMEKSYKKGIRVMEADMSLSSDGKLILLHSTDATSLSNLGLPTSWKKEMPSEKEFLETKILNKYNTLNFKEVAQYMKEHPDMYLVVDLKKNDIHEVEGCYKELVKVAKQVDPSVLNRIIPQIYYEEMYRPVMNIYDFKSMIFTTYRIEELEVNKVVDFSYEHGIKIVAANKFKFSKELTTKLVDRGISLYMFTYNDEEAVNSLRNSYVSGFYTDFLPKEKIERDSEGKVIVDKKKMNEVKESKENDKQ
ncbi:phosphatidylinositol-specific phospholipase C/glycerophosphodiester phosphodiesterase family protein [Peptostreptococcus russellii]|uniref:phosphatidylinositol-specific phospholipase C/glycerophosphodiester phosphodiesterase family protein n=1 Tax=Peptostreptococcus russellii TaxID=215200 RepID=UPI003F58D37E